MSSAAGTAVLDPRPVYLGEGMHASFAMLHEPAGIPSGCAVLICPPFGNSDNGSYMPRRTWAQRLAGDGHPVLRLDLPGTGDSPGAPRDPGIAESWSGAIGDAATWLRATYGLRVAVIGLGLGGLIAAGAVQQGAPIDDLVLWAVPSRGRRFLRELRMFEAMLAARVYDGTETEPGQAATTMVTESHEDGSLESAGFVLSAESVQAIQAIDLATLPVGAGAGHRVLLLDRDGIDVEERLVSALADWGAKVERAPGPGFWTMMAAPYESLAPEQVMETVDAWLARAPAPADDRAPSVRTAPPPPQRDAMQTMWDGVAVTERPIAVAHPGGRLLGIVTTPVHDVVPPTHPATGLAIVLVHSGTLRRVGPSRMWVELARRWAARGVPVVRFDLARESDLSPEILGRFHPAHARPGDVFWDHYESGFSGQFGAVLDALVADGLGARFLVAGLCSGAYWALDRLREDDRVAAAALVNCPQLRWNELALVENDVRKLGDRETWRRLLAGDIPTERLLGAARTMTQLLVTRRRRTATAGDEVDLLLERLDARGQEATFVFATGERLRLELERTGRMDALRASPHVTVEFLDSPLQAHVLESVVLQRDTHGALDRAIARALPATPPAEASPAGRAGPA